MSSYQDDDEVQVPETSSPSKEQLQYSSSPLKGKATDTPTKPDSMSVLRDKFTFNPKPHTASTTTSMAGAASMKTNPIVSSLGDQISALEGLSKEYPGFSKTLLQAVLKSNSYNITLARERLTKILNQREKWSTKKATTPSPSQSPQPTHRTRLPTLINTRKQQLNNNNTAAATQASSKITLAKQKTSIFDRYSSVINKTKKSNIASPINDPLNLQFDPNLLKKIPQHNAKKTLKRLIRGNERDILLRKWNDDKPTLKKQRKNPTILPNDNDEEEEESEQEDEDLTVEEEEISDEEYEEKVAVLDIDDQVFKFINEADTLDLADLADTTFEKAKLIVSLRPFASLYDFKNRQLEPKAKEGEEDSTKGVGRGRGRRKNVNVNENERILDRITLNIRGYNAIDSLIKKCSSYGNLVSSQMAKWGVTMDDITNNNELNIIDEEDEKNPHDGVVEDFDETEVSNSTTPVPISIPSLKKEEEEEEEAHNNKSTGNDASGSESEFEEDEEDIADDSDEDYDEDEDAVVKSNRKKSQKQEPAPLKVNVQRKGIVKYFKGKPRLLNPEMTLKDYQQTGINWLNLLYHNQMSCILADDMGLGKTCQVISFFAYLKQINEPGPHLVVVPSSTLENWLREFQKFCPSLKIEPYYGSQNERAELREILERNSGKYDVIVTTYNLAAGNKYDVSFLRNRQFNVIVYDEGHMLKNSFSERFNKLMKIRGNFRLLLTGTPLQNNLKELMSLLEFIMPQLFISKKDSLATVFKQRAKTTDDNQGHNPLLVQEAIDRAKTMMTPFILRRRKDQVLKHLPKRHNKIEYCDMTNSQREIYEQEVNTVMEHKRMISEGILPDDPKERAIIQNSSSKNIIMALRKASIHPLLFRKIYTDKIISKMSDAILDEPAYRKDGNREYIKEDMSVMSDFELHKLCGSFPRTLSRFRLKKDEWMESGKVNALCKVLKEIIIEKKEKVLIFSLFTQVLDILEMVLSTLKYKFLRLDGSTQVNDRQSLIDKFYDDDTIPVFILSTKAGGFGINLVCANNVLIFDQSFNPHDDRQAADRAHRVGQTKEVTVTTLITKDSIEEKIHQLAKNKLALDSHVSEGDKKAEEALETKVSDILEDIIFKEEKKTVK
ncbi:DNA-dependent ATPase FUN30 NDAI_0H02500 [Naumovozyma dairenensis CBS 421]|uniref:DNA helicase n=1 Tax=Naumovozyma dairenensis (strain ATCC 10597 / BCRC 20456 / CBS 421 / NBRC 0211 / NRRL Y-12639) TaxID=1071378 RepID=G0WF63_NAUDC|nr:hypothetical protein NDAI_0H02500 [Naumovozyma dairenensis CBS 421]CCD26424.1 hypothetical protein NDAI_0H02500 [Naumovozyma dairenensis CBS 421]